jgi:type II secretory pathway component HofQ
MMNLNDLAAAYDAASARHDRAVLVERAYPCKVNQDNAESARSAKVSAHIAYENEVRAIDARQREAIARAQAVAA